MTVAERKQRKSKSSTDNYIAIFELVKNSYDANAKDVDIIFKNLKQRDETTRIIIRDDGNGMSLHDIKDKWLFIGYSEKKEIAKKMSEQDYRDNIGARRIFAGAKGIGRFSCDRLGDKLIMYSKILNENFIHKLTVDWTEFEDDSLQEFQSIIVDYEKVKSVDIPEIDFPQNKGVILEIWSTQKKLNWNVENFRTLKRRLQRLINPSHVTPELEFSIYISAVEFKQDDEEYKKKVLKGRNKRKKDIIKQNPNLPEAEIENMLEREINSDIENNIINGFVRNFVFEQLDLKTTRLSCEIDPSGEYITTRCEDKGKFIYEVKEKNLDYPDLYNVKILIFYLNRNAKSTFTRLMGIQSVNYGSIFLYKNGFKINPLGNPRDDWLGLETRKTQGYARYLSTREVMGRIEVLGYQPGFEEVSSRDGGIIKTIQYDEIRDFFKIIPLRRLENYVVEALDWDNPSEKKPIKSESKIRMDSLKLIGALIGKDKTEQMDVEFNKDLLNIYIEKEIEKTPDLIKSLEKLQDEVDTEIVNLSYKNIRNTFTSVVKKQKELEKELELMEKQSLFLKNAIGQEKEEIIGLQHQIRLSGNIMKNDLKLFKYKIDRGTITNEYLYDLLDKLMLEIHKITSTSQIGVKQNMT